MKRFKMRVLILKNFKKLIINLKVIQILLKCKRIQEVTKILRKNLKLKWET